MTDPTPPESAPVTLRPCPLCNHATVGCDQFDPDYSDYFWARCYGCGAEGPPKDTRAEAIAAWNTRHVDNEDARYQAAFGAAAEHARTLALLADPATVNAVTRAIAAAWCDGAGCTGANPCGVCDNRAASALIAIVSLIEGPRT